MEWCIVKLAEIVAQVFNGAAARMRQTNRQTCMTNIASLSEVSGRNPKRRITDRPKRYLMIPSLNAFATACDALTASSLAPIRVK